MILEGLAFINMLSQATDSHRMVYTFAYIKEYSFRGIMIIIPQAKPITSLDIHTSYVFSNASHMFNMLYQVIFSVCNTLTIKLLTRSLETQLAILYAKQQYCHGDCTSVSDSGCGWRPIRPMLLSFFDILSLCDVRSMDWIVVIKTCTYHQLHTTENQNFRYQAQNNKFGEISLVGLLIKFTVFKQVINNASIYWSYKFILMRLTTSSKHH